jgi:4-hydroxy-2-oxoheptanedioate aldolase
MRPSVIKKKLLANKPALLVQLHLTDPSLFEMVSLMGFDGIWLDLEHHAHSIETAGALIRAARVHRADVLTRSGKGEYAQISRLLEAGAAGIMYPRCGSSEEAAEVVKWAKFAPLGERGIDGAGPDAPYCMMPIAEYVKGANENTFVTVQLEDPSALKQAREIVNVPGVDALFFGPADFSILSGFPGRFDDDRIVEAARHVSNVAKEAGKHWGMPAFSLEHAQQLLDMGARLIAHSADILMVKTGLEQIREQFGKLGFQFDAASLC